MLDSDEKPSLGGQEKDITAYFTDIASFSTFSEKNRISFQTSRTIE
jgi:adenylate cyclase